MQMLKLQLLKCATFVLFNLEKVEKYLLEGSNCWGGQKNYFDEGIFFFFWWGGHAMTLLVPLVLSLIGKFAVLVTFTEVHCSPK